MFIEIALVVAGTGIYFQLPVMFRAAGRRSQQRGNHRQAYYHFLRAGSLLPPVKPFTEFRAVLMTQAALAAVNAGMSDEAIQLAEKSIENSPNIKRQMVSHSVLALCYGAKGQLAAQTEQREKALALAEELGDTAHIAQYSAGIAGSQYKQGRLVEAIAASERAEDTDPSAARIALMVKAECFRKLGRYPEAISALQKAQTTSPHPAGFWEDRSQSTLLLAMADIYADDGDIQAGLNVVTSAKMGFADDTRLQLWCDAAESNLLALSGEIEKASVLVNSVMKNLEALPDDLPTHEKCLGFIGKASLNVGEPAQALQYFGRFLSVATCPVDLPDVYFWIGECHLRLGNEAEARIALEKATQFDFETVYTRRAAARLAELDTAQE